MGGRDLTRIERLQRAFFTGGIDLPRIAGGKIAAVAYVVVAFFRWVWLRLSRKTAYRFEPMHETKIDPASGDIHQANGMVIPTTWDGKPRNTCDWRAAILEQLEKEKQ